MLNADRIEINWCSIWVTDSRKIIISDYRETKTSLNILALTIGEVFKWPECKKIVQGQADRLEHHFLKMRKMLDFGPETARSSNWVYLKLAALLELSNMFSILVRQEKSWEEKYVSLIFWSFLQDWSAWNTPLILGLTIWTGVQECIDLKVIQQIFRTHVGVISKEQFALVIRTDNVG